MTCTVGCGTGREVFTNGVPVCVFRTPGSSSTWEVKTGVNETAFCPTANPASVKPKAGSICVEYEDCEIRCRPPSELYDSYDGSYIAAADPFLGASTEGLVADGDLAASSTAVTAVAAAAVEGVYECIESDSRIWSSCVSFDMCGAGTQDTEFVCFDKRSGALATNATACEDAALAQPIESSQSCITYTGCGEWLCASTAAGTGAGGAAVSVFEKCKKDCPVGCGEATEVFTNGEPACVRNGTAVDLLDIGEVCPTANTARPKPELVTCTDLKSCAFRCLKPNATDSTTAASGAMPTSCSDDAAWSTCDATAQCGAGSSSTIPVCYDEKALTSRPTQQCSTLTPLSETKRECTTFTGCGSWRCLTGSSAAGDVYSECVASCPQGCGSSSEVFNGNVTCVQGSDTTSWAPVDSAMCPPDNLDRQRPSEQPCSATSTCQWQCQLLDESGLPRSDTMANCTDAMWSSCSVTCGFGVQQRSTGCYAPPSQGISDWESMGDDFCEGAGTRPLTEESCEAYAGCLFKWQCAVKGTTNYQSCDVTSATFGSCDSSCGTVIQTRDVVCMDNENNVRDSSFCTTTKPVETQECTGSGCTYQWGCFLTSPTPGSCSGTNAVWSACSATCGSGNRTRSASCFTSQGVLVTDPSICNSDEQAGGQPVLQSSCTSYVGCSWSYGDWSACACKATASSAEPNRTRTASCHDTAVRFDVDRLSLSNSHDFLI